MSRKRGIVREQLSPEVLEVIELAAQVMLGPSCMPITPMSGGEPSSGGLSTARS